MNYVLREYTSLHCNRCTQNNNYVISFRRL